jgi:hypothetical protein
VRPILHSMETDGGGEVFKFNVFFLDEISTAPARKLPTSLQTLLTTLRMAARIRWEVLERFKNIEWNQNNVNDCEMAFSRIEREGQLFGDWDVKELCKNYAESEREDVFFLVNRLRALKGHRTSGPDNDDGELDKAFRDFDVYRIEPLMTEYWELINNFLSITLPVLGEIIKD